MSDSQAYEEVTGTSDGVTVVKRFEEDEFPVPAIAFEFTSERDEPVQVTMTDAVPDGVAVEDLGFHPEYGSEYWTIDEAEITFERELEANTEYTTVYGIRATGTEDVEKFLTVPEITAVDPPIDEAGPTEDDIEVEDDVIPESDDDVVRDVISGESDDVPGLDEESDDEIETLDLADPNDGGTSATQPTPEPAEGESESANEQAAESTVDQTTESSANTDETRDDSVAAVSGDTLVEALAAEIRANNVSAEDVKLLRQAFEIAGQEGGSIQARVERLQTDVADLRAYSDAMEEFLDDNGTAQQLLDEFESDIEAIESSVDDMEATVEDNSEEVAAISDEVSSLGSDVAEIGADLEDVSDDVDSVEETVADLEDSLSDLEETVDDIQESVTDEDVGDRLADIESDLAELQTWQEQIKETFGG